MWRVVLAFHSLRLGKAGEDGCVRADAVRPRRSGSSTTTRSKNARVGGNSGSATKNSESVREIASSHRIGGLQVLASLVYGKSIVAPTGNQFVTDDFAVEDRLSAPGRSTRQRPSPAFHSEIHGDGEDDVLRGSRRRGGRGGSRAGGACGRPRKRIRRRVGAANDARDHRHAPLRRMASVPLIIDRETRSSRGHLVDDPEPPSEPIPYSVHVRGIGDLGVLGVAPRSALSPTYARKVVA